MSIEDTWVRNTMWRVRQCRQHVSWWWYNGRKFLSHQKLFPEDNVSCGSSPLSIYENCNTTSRLSDHFSIFGLVFFVLEPLLGIARQWSCMEFAISTPNAQSHGRIQEAHGLLNGNINTGVFSFCNWEEANNIASIEILNRNAPFNDALLTLRVNQSNHLSQCDETCHKSESSPTTTPSIDKLKKTRI